MTGDECVAVCSDLRYGRELQTIATDFPKVKNDNTDEWNVQKYITGLPGLRDEPLPLGGSAWPRNRHSNGKAVEQLFPSRR